MPSADWNQLLRPEVIWVFVPITAILVGGTLAVLRMINEHEERMAMIERGMRPEEPAQG